MSDHHAHGNAQEYSALIDATDERLAERWIELKLAYDRATHIRLYHTQMLDGPGGQITEDYRQLSRQTQEISGRLDAVQALIAGRWLHERGALDRYGDASDAQHREMQQRDKTRGAA